jgi:hypothetical protein
MSATQVDGRTTRHAVIRCKASLWLDVTIHRQPGITAKELLSGLHAAGFRISRRRVDILIDELIQAGDVVEVASEALHGAGADARCKAYMASS